MQEKIFHAFLVSFLAQNPTQESIQRLKLYVDRVPALALSKEVYETFLKHGVENVSEHAS